MKQKKILHFPGIMTEGGVESLLMNWYRNIDHAKVQFDFCVTRSTPGPLDKEIKELGGKVIYVPTFKNAGLRQIKRITSIIKENGPYDAVHIHSTHMGVFALIAAQKAGIKNRIYHVHSTQNLAIKNIPFKRYLEKYIGRIIQSIATCRIACSKPAGEFVFGSKPFIVINNAIDLVMYTPFEANLITEGRKKLKIPSNALVIGNVARFVPGKNQDFIVKIIAEDKRRRGRLFGLFVGDGITRREIENLSNYLNCTDRILFVGRQNNTPFYYNCMDVFCLPSDFEGLGMVAVEAQSCGIPCLVSQGVPDEAKMGSVLFEKLKLEDNISKWIEKIYSFEHKRNFNKEETAFITSEKGYSISNIVGTIQNIYKI